MMALTLHPSVRLLLWCVVFLLVADYSPVESAEDAADWQEESLSNDDWDERFLVDADNSTDDGNATDTTATTLPETIDTSSTSTVPGDDSVSSCPGVLLADGVNYAVTDLSQLPSAIDDNVGYFCSYSYSSGPDDPPITKFILTRFSCDNGCEGYYINENYIFWDQATQTEKDKPTCPTDTIDSCYELEEACAITGSHSQDYACSPNLDTGNAIKPGEFTCQSAQRPHDWCVGGVLDTQSFSCPPVNTTYKTMTHFCTEGYDVDGDDYVCYHPWGTVVCEGMIDESTPIPACQQNLTSCHPDVYSTVCEPDQSAWDTNFCGNDSGMETGTSDTFECWEKSTQHWCKGSIVATYPSCPTEALSDCAELDNTVGEYAELCTCSGPLDGFLGDELSFTCAKYGSEDVWCQGVIDPDNGFRSPGCPPASITEDALIASDCESLFIFANLYSCTVSGGATMCGGTIEDGGAPIIPSSPFSSPVSAPVSGPTPPSQSPIKLFTDDDSLPVVDGDSEKNFAGLSDVETQQVLAVVLAVVVAALAGCCFCRMCRSGRRRNAGFYSGVEAMDGDLELQPTYANIPIT